MTPAQIHWVVLGGAFAIFWFLALQIVLPMGIQTPHETGEDTAAGTDPGAPLKPRLGLKLLIATGFAIIAWLIFYLLTRVGVLNL